MFYSRIQYILLSKGGPGAGKGISPIYIYHLCALNERSVQER